MWRQQKPQKGSVLIDRHVGRGQKSKSSYADQTQAIDARKPKY